MGWRDEGDNDDGDSDYGDADDVADATIILNKSWLEMGVTEPPFRNFPRFSLLLVSNSTSIYLKGV